MSDYSSDPHQNPYWQNLNGQSNQGWENRQNTRNTDPNWHPEGEYARQLSHTASMLGIFSLISNFMVPIIFPLILGGTAIVLAIISKGRSDTYPKRAKSALITGGISVIINVILIVVCCATLYLAFTDPEVNEQFNDVMENMYGYTLDDLFEGVEGTYGITIQEETL